MKKNKIIIVSIALLGFISLGSSLWYMSADKKVSLSTIHAKQVSFNTVDEIITFSQLVVTGKPIESENFVTFDERGFTVDAYTITQFKINKVLENRTTHDYKAGDIIKVAEPSYVYDNGIMPGKTKFSINNYRNMDKNHSYMLLLVPDFKYDDLYVISVVNEGKHNIDIPGNDGEKVGVPQEAKNYKFKEELMKKFNLK
ncbi:hypothetical protein CS060_06355 [Anoxybacillus flavithermus]|uniref:Uncharacterized protein n=2 Tax=Anoxybacillaceae TaxID=3120669 RepID=A0A2G5RR72_9BACL|nr:hypothetical protein JS80_12315 [Anoxybacillus sp. KU2-6(11)]PIC05161.1 hypothetical protein CS060_06355 [Anoxybacillus flavithermus]